MGTEHEIPAEILAFRLPSDRCPSVDVDGEVYSTPYGLRDSFVWNQRLIEAEQRQDAELAAMARRVLEFYEGPGPFALYVFGTTRLALLHDQGSRSVLLLAGPRDDDRSL